MPIQLPGHEPGLGGGLSSWLGRLVTFVNGLEVQLRGRPSLEQQLAGRQDAVAQQIRQQIGAERTAQQQVAAGLRGQLDDETRARIEATMQIADVRDALNELEDRVDGLGTGDVTSTQLNAVRTALSSLTRVVDDQAENIAERAASNDTDIARLRQALTFAARFPLVIPCDPQFVGSRAGNIWTRLPGNAGIHIPPPPLISGYTIRLTCRAYGCRVTRSGVWGRLRLRAVAVTNPGQSVQIRGTSEATIAVPLVTTTSEASYLLEYNIFRPSTASDLDGLRVAYAVVQAVIS